MSSIGNLTMDGIGFLSTLFVFAIGIGALAAEACAGFRGV